MPPITHMRGGMGALPPTTDPAPHKKLDETEPALEAAGGQWYPGPEVPEVQGSTRTLGTPAKERPGPLPTIGARIARLPSAIGLVRAFGLGPDAGTQARGAHGMVAAGASSSTAVQAPWVVNINTFRLAPQPWDTQYVAGVVTEAES